MFDPESVVLIGAGVHQNSAGRTVMKNLASGGFEGKIFHVNPDASPQEGISAYTGMHKLPNNIDLAVIAVPMKDVLEIIEVCGEKHMGGAIIISIPEEQASQTDPVLCEKIRDISKQTGMRVIGPASAGIISGKPCLNASLMHTMPLQGKIVFLSQNSAACASILDMAMQENVGFSHFVSLGAMPDVCFADLIDFFGSDYTVESIVMVLERLDDIRKFMSAARAVSRVKPVIALKADRAGRLELLSEDRLYGAAFRRAGILRVNEFEALFDCAEFLAKQKRPKGDRLAIISNTGGISIMAKDALTRHGLVPAEFTQETRKNLFRALKADWAETNPIDIPFYNLRSDYVTAVKTCMEAPEVDGLLLLGSPIEPGEATSLARELAALVNVCPCPVLTAWTGGKDMDNARSIFNRAGIVTYDTPERAIRAFVNLYQYGKRVEMLQQIPVRTDRRLGIDYEAAQEIIDRAASLDDPELPDDLARALVSAYGIPVGSCSAEGPADYELVVGAMRHPDFGPVIRFGVGGVMTDVFKDIALGLPPLNRQLARAMIERTKISRVLSGYKEIVKIDIEVLEEILIRVSRLITDFESIRHLEINPVRVCKGDIRADDGCVILRKDDVGKTGKMIISPYPYWQEKTIAVKDNEKIFIRPVRPSDADQMINLFEQLSPETVYLRFFSPIKEISRPMLIRMTQIDYDREIALIAFSGDKASRKIVGVSRIIFMPEGNTAEFAIVLADAWQGRGLGKKLLHHALVCTKKYDIDTVWGPVITTNKGMLKMGQQLGFDVRRDSDSGEYKMSISVDEVPELI